MKSKQRITNFEQLLDLIEGEAADKDQVDLRMILDVVGNRSYGPILLIAGLVILAPLLGDMPGVPTAMALLVLLTSGQLLLRKDHYWLPKWMLNRSVNREKLAKALKWLQRPARWLDAVFRPRLFFLTEKAGRYCIILLCSLVALATPAMEFIPFSANGAGITFLTLGLALIVRDGLVVLLSLTVTGATFTLIAVHFL